MQIILNKKVKKDQTLIYKNLVVPMSMRSIYWKYFGFPATEEGDILTKHKIVCVLCKTQIAYNHNTSNLRMHLQNRHANEFFELEANAPPRHQTTSKERCTQRKLYKATGTGEGTPHIYSTTADGVVEVEGDIQLFSNPTINLQSFEDYENDNSENSVHVVLKSSSDGLNSQGVEIILPEDSETNYQEIIDDKTVSDAIMKFVINDLQLPDVVEGRGFQRLIATLKSPCEIPSKTQLEKELIPKFYDSFRESMHSSMTSLSGIQTIFTYFFSL